MKVEERRLSRAGCLEGRADGGSKPRYVQARTFGEQPDERARLCPVRRSELIRSLLRSGDPSIRWRTRVRVLGESRRTPQISRLEQEIRRSSRVRKLLSHQHAPYRHGTMRSVYYYWQGLHWVLGALAELGYPCGDLALKPLVDRTLGVWLHPRFFRTFPANSKAAAYRKEGVPVIHGRPRRCASQQGSALHYVTKLGLSDDRWKHLVDLLLRWQWPDGGWNCDRIPEADTSSFMESLLPMRGLAVYAAETANPAARKGAERASEVFLQRSLFRRKSDGDVMARDFLRLHYPLYWHYDVLGGLKGMVEVGRIRDPRCSDALDWLEQKELPDGGWAADARYHRVSPTFRSNSEFVNWGGTNRRQPNDWVTTDALFVLREAGRFTP